MSDQPKKILITDNAHERRLMAEAAAAGEVIRKPQSPVGSTGLVARWPNLALGARFKYIGGDKVWVKLSHRNIAEWAPLQITAGWAGQQICCFGETDEDYQAEVEVVE